jgi:hypothetical protein
VPSLKNKRIYNRVIFRIESNSTVFCNLVGRMGVHMRDQGIFAAVGCLRRKTEVT